MSDETLPVAERSAPPDGANLPFRCGYIALVGRPNVGKSTLLNAIIGQKLSIVTRRPQTTRHQLLGIHTTADAQMLFVDTPGMHLGQKKALNRYMNRVADNALEGVDVAVMVVEALRWGPEDDNVLARIRSHGVRAILAVNKVDRMRHRDELLPFIAAHSQDFEFSDVVPISARNKTNLDSLHDCMMLHLPARVAEFPEDQITDKSVRFLCAEAVREKLTRRLGQELPYGLGVQIEEFDEQPGLTTIGAIIWIERSSHKPIVIGKGGKNLKEVGREARADIEAMIEKHVFLRLWVKVREGWANDERALQQLGYRD
jgi:GTPase